MIFINNLKQGAHTKIPKFADGAKLFPAVQCQYQRQLTPERTHVGKKGDRYIQGREIQSDAKII